MFVHLCILFLWCAPLSSAAAFRPRGNHTAPYTNQTSITTSSSAFAANTPLSGPAPTTTLFPPYPIVGTGTGFTSEHGRPKPTDPGSANLSVSRNHSDPACTINVPNANIDWWYPATYDHPVGTLRKTVGNATDGEPYYTNIPNPTPFDVSSAVQSEYVFTPVESYDPEWDVTWTFYEEYTIKPSATSTLVVTRDAAPTMTGNRFPASEIRKYDPPDAFSMVPSVILASKANSTFAMSSATPFVYFTAYEVESVVDGITSTETVQLPQVRAYEYYVKGIEELATASGSVPAEFIQQIPESDCDAGSLSASITVVIVVTEFYINMPSNNPFIIHLESSVDGFEETNDIFAAAETGIDSPGFPLTMLPDFPNAVTTGADNLNPAVQQTPAPTTRQNAQNAQNAGSNPAPVPDVPEPTQQTIGTIGTEPVVRGTSSVIIVGTQTLQPGGPPVTIGGNPVSLVPSGTAIVVGTRTSALPPAAPEVGQPGQPQQPQQQPQRPPILTIGSSTLTPNAATQFFIRPGQTLTPGGTATIDGTVVSLAPSASFIVIGGSTQIIPTAAPTSPARPEIVIGGTTFTALPGGSNPSSSNPGNNQNNGNPPNGNQNNQNNDHPQGNSENNQNNDNPPGNSENNQNNEGDGQSPNQNNDQNSQNSPSSPGDSNNPNPDSPNNPNANSPSNSNPTFVISGSTLAPGQAITVDGTTVSLGPSGSFVVINGATSTLQVPNVAAAHVTPPPLTIGNGVFTAQPGSGTTYLIGSETLTPGGVITAAGTTISLAPGATALIVNGQTTTLTPSNQPPITNPPLLTIGSQTFTAAPGTGTTFLIGGQTLTPGGTITVDGTTISLAPGATQLEYGSSGRTTTTALFPATTTRSQPGVTTGTGTASAGATGRNGEAAETSAKGVAARAVGKRESWILSLVGALGFLIV